MDELMIYLIKSSVCLMLLFGLYQLALRRETFFRFNRAYLLFSLGISFLIPLIGIHYQPANDDTGISGVLEVIQVGQGPAMIANNSGPTWHLITIVYLSVMGILFFRLLYRLSMLILMRRQSIIEKKDGLYIALCRRQVAPFSFFRTVFIDGSSNEQNLLDKVLMHETVHIRQFHSLDIIISEINCLLTWFNPASWMIKAALKETHEYLADSGVSEQTPDSTEYFMLLVRNSIGVQPGLANNFNKSLTFKRLEMMKKTRSGRLSLLKALPVLPLVALMLMAFSCKSNADDTLPQNTNTPPAEEKEATLSKIPEYAGGQEALIKFIIENVKYPADAKKNNIQGTVYVTFTVSKTGKVTNAKVIKPVDKLLDAEAIRVVSGMPDWIPGEDKGAAVDVEMTLPVAFKLSEK